MALLTAAASLMTGFPAGLLARADDAAIRFEGGSVGSWSGTPRDLMDGTYGRISEEGYSWSNGTWLRAEGFDLTIYVDLQQPREIQALSMGCLLYTSLAARKNLHSITMPEIEEATIKVVMGTEKRSHVITDKEKNLTSYHEAGHAVVTYYCLTQDQMCIRDSPKPRQTDRFRNPRALPALPSGP